jgi:uncharacterized protein (DUF1697 family)
MRTLTVASPRPAVVVTCRKRTISVTKATMPVLLAFLRAVNVGGHAKIKMDALRELFLSLKFAEPQTYVQSGNVIFKSSERDLVGVAKRIQQGIDKKFGCCPEVVLRTPDDLRAVISKNPFRNRSNIEPGKLLVSFLATEPAKDAEKSLAALRIRPEELHLIGRELFIYFPNGQGKSRLPWARVDKALQTAGTGRNWNSVTKILEIAERLES